MNTRRESEDFLAKDPERGGGVGGWKITKMKHQG